MSDQQSSDIQRQLRTAGTLTDYPIKLAEAVDGSQDGWLCGLSTMDDPNQYSGAIFVLRVYWEAGNELAGLSDYQHSLLPYVLERSHSREMQEMERFLLEYYLIYIKSLFNLALQEGGAPLSQLFLDEMDGIARDMGWRLHFTPREVIESESASLDELLAALPVLLNTARRFTSQLTDPITVEMLMQAVHASIGDANHSVAAQIRKYNEGVA